MTTPITFEDLDIHANIKKALAACNYINPTPVQEKAIPEALTGKDVVASSQTGSGKTAAFVIPILHFLASQEPSRTPRALILTPTRELATQITTAARMYGKFMNFNIVSLVGGMSYDPQIRDLNRGADIIVATPGRLIDHMENKRVDLSKVEILVLDEADRMVDMGFIDDVEIIASKTPESRQTLFFSATMDKSITKIIKRLLKDPTYIDMTQQQISKPKIKQTLYKAKNIHHKSRMLKHFMNDENIFKAIIFSATKINADRLCVELRDDGFAAAPLHGDLRQNVRNRTIEAFRRGKIQFLVATDVAARGLDINDVSHVINFDLPKFCEDYVHRIGRTGRAGKEGEAISFFTNSDMRNLQSIERYIGKRLTIQSDNFVYAESSKNVRSDAENFSPDNMLESNDRGGRHRSGGRSQGGPRRFNDGPRSSSSDRPRRSFNRDEPRSFGDKPESADRPRRSFDRDEPRSAKPFGEKRAYHDKPADSTDRPRRSFDRDEPRSAKPFGEKRRFNDKPSDSTDRPRRSFDRDEPRSAKPFGEKRRFNDKPADASDRPRRSFDRDEPRSAKPFGEKRRFNDKPESSDRPRKSFNRDDANGNKSFGDKRRTSSRPESSDRDTRSSKPFGEKRSFGNKPRRNDGPGESGFSDNKPRGRSSERTASVFERPVYEFEKRDDNPRVLYKKRVDTVKSRSSDKPERPKSASSFDKPRTRTVRDSADKKPRFGDKKPATRTAAASKHTKKAYRDAK